MGVYGRLEVLMYIDFEGWGKFIACVSGTLMVGERLYNYASKLLQLKKKEAKISVGCKSPTRRRSKKKNMLDINRLMVFMSFLRPVSYQI